MKGGWPSAAVFVFVIALLSGAHFASADQTNVELLIDDSGSMAQGIGGGKKIDVAKQVLSGLIHDLPAEAQVAVRTYGRRQPSRLKDCGDMELLVPFGPNTAERVLPGVQALKPNGMTPIAASLQAAAADFSGREGQNNIVILLSDGEEDCHGDPCAAAKTLHDAGIHLEINVIGLHVQPNERTQLQCVAKSGGGKYYDAANAGELKVAASEVKERIATAPAPTPQASPTPFDLLAKANGGQVLVAPNDKWLKTISGDESGVVFDYGGAGEAVFAFKDEQPATFDTFAMLIPGTGDNVREFELFTASDSPTGNFTSIGKFTAANVKMIKSPYQEFKFAPVTAKYLKVKILSSYNPNGTVLYQFRLTGKPAVPVR
jgi:Mg-chelatase subunit ChlD